MKISTWLILLISLLTVTLIPTSILLLFNLFILSKEDYYQKMNSLNEAMNDLYDAYTTKKLQLKGTISNLSILMSDFDYSNEGLNRSKLIIILNKLESTANLDFLLIIDTNARVIARADSNYYGDKIDVPKEALRVFQGQTLVSPEIIEYKNFKKETKGLINLSVPNEKLCVPETSHDLLKLDKGVFLVAGSPIHNSIHSKDKVIGILVGGKYLDKEYFDSKKNSSWPPDIDVDFLPSDIPVAKDQNIVSRPIYSINNKLVAHILVWFDSNKKNQVLSTTQQLTILDAVITVLLAFIASFIIANKLVKPIVLLDKYITNIINGNYSEKLFIDGPREIGRLCSSFNRLTKDLEEKSQMQKDFVATLTHDMRVPLHAEEKILKLIISEPKYQDYANQRKLIEGMLKSNQDHLKLINNLLDSFKFEEGRYKINKTENNMVEIFKICIDELTPLIKDKSMQFNFDYAEEVMNANVDAFEIQRVIVNLLSNAIKFTPDEGKITIKLYYENSNILFSISDTGVGMTEEEIAGLFNRYSSNARKLKTIGTGLGLYLSYFIITSHGGTIAVQSELEKGTTFLITLPIC